MFLRLIITTTLLSLAVSARAEDPAEAALQTRFAGRVLPFVETYCAGCHSREKPKGDFDLSPFTDLKSVVNDYRRWEMVLEKLSAEEMPPEKAKKFPTPESRRAVIDWIGAMRRHEADKHAGDPGIVLARRLSNAEYDYTIRDLTGVDIRPTREFPVDPANEAGFDNSGESLAMSPSLVKKYLEAARKVTEYLVLKPEGFDFAPHPVITDTDRDKYCVRRIINFYQQHTPDLADYFLAAWRLQHRAALGKPEATIAEVAAEAKISPKYLATLYATLVETPAEIGPIAGIQAMWRALPAPDPKQPDIARHGCEQMRDLVVSLRQKVKPEYKNLMAKGVHPGSQSLVLWKDRQYATHRMTYAGGALQLKPSELAPGTAAAPALAIPDDVAARERYESTFKRFCAIFPDAFFITERARPYLDAQKEEKLAAGRLLSAGFHSQMGYFRDDQPLCELVLNPDEVRELDGLWHELDFITSAPMRQHTGFIWFERTDSRFMIDAEFDFARAEDKDCTSEAKIKQLAEVYLNKVRRATSDEMVLGVIHEHFDRVNANVRWVEQARLAAEPSHLIALQNFAERAYRRPLSAKERDAVVAFYHTLRREDGMSHEDAIRDTVVSILMSPYFCYRIDLPSAGEGVRPLPDSALASRLSYFLWSSMPDRELLDHAAAGDLHQPAVLAAQARRMLRDARVRGLATEFGGNWLDFRRFEEHNAVDRERFKTFDNDLRQAMFEEPIRFIVDLVQHDRPVLDFIYADHTFVNRVLAPHYGIPGIDGPADEWVRIDDAGRYGRGGLLPMAVFLTKNAPGLRTSPVKRGYWVIRSLLGERVPPPPANVPVLPADEANMGELTLPQALARHREDKSCAVCHVHFDSIGLAFEGYGPIGEARTKDLGGRPVENHATFPNGSNGTGFAGLRTYLHDYRQDDFLDNLCRKLLANALGRTLILSDDSTIRDMRSKLAANGYRFSSLVESIVSSPQFLNKRGRE